VRPFFVVVFTPSLQLFGSIRKRQEPVLVQALGAEAAIEGFDEGVIGGLAWPGEVEHDAALIGPEVHVAGYELAALIDTDRLGVAGRSAHPVERRDHIFAAVAVSHIEHWNVSREKVSTTVRTRNFLPVASWS
jgi:hypothetical protein